jgi:hypothetical protein
MKTTHNLEKAGSEPKTAKGEAQEAEESLTCAPACSVFCASSVLHTKKSAGFALGSRWNFSRRERTV